MAQAKITISPNQNNGPSFSIVGDDKIFGPLSKFNDDLSTTPTLNPNNVISNLNTNSLFNKPFLVDYDDYKNLGLNANLVSMSPLDDDFKGNSTAASSQKPMSPRLINWVEPYDIGGEKKTLFYTEVNSGLKVGDKVFIINGNYDSDLLIKSNKYRRGRDGYKILYIDKCQVVLDIDYKDILPYNTISDDDCINVYFIDSVDDFRWAEKSFTTKGATFSRKFNYYNNNVIFTNKNYGPVDVWGLKTKIQEAPGFFVRNTSNTMGLDNSLNTGFGFLKNSGSSYVNVIEQDLVNDNLLIGGSFNSYNNFSINNLVCLNPSGDINSDFLGVNGVVSDIKTEGSGSSLRYLVGGSFTTYYNDTLTFSIKSLFKLKSDGTLDTTFTGVGVPSTGTIKTILPLSSGKILIGGDFTGGIKRLNSDGSNDTTFTGLTSGFDGVVNIIREEPITGKIIVGGDFTTYNGSTANKIVKLDSVGSIDNSYSNGFDFQVYDIVYRTTTKLLIVGEFLSFDSNYYNRIIAINEDGTLDTTFDVGTGFDSVAKTISVANDGKVFIGGEFNTYNGIEVNQLVKLNSDGTLDTDFKTGYGFSNLTSINEVKSYSTDEIYVCGNFTTYNANIHRNLIKMSVSPWISVSHDFISGSYSYILSPSSNANKIKILNGGFTYSSINGDIIEFKEDQVYKFDMDEEPNAIRGSFSTWVTDITYNVPIITKTNFRGGNFNGVWNTGVFGKSNKKIIWDGETSTWNTGTLLNSIWKKGVFGSLFSLKESYSSEFDDFGLPIQKTILPDNNSRKYNFIIDSTFESGTIENGTIISSVLGLSGATFSIIENSILSQTNSSIINVLSANFENTTLNNTLVNNSELKNIRANNSSLIGVKSINSYFKRSYMKNSDFISDSVIKILDYDEFNISEYYGNVGASHKVYRFYISEKSYKRLKLNDSFFIKGLNINNGQNKLVNFFDKRFKIGSWNEYVDHFFDSTDLNTPNKPIFSNSIVEYDSFYKRGIDSAAFLNTPTDNGYTFNTILDGLTYSTSTLSDNSKKMYSIDIVFSIKDNDFNIVSDLNFNRDVTIGLTLSNPIGNIIDVTGAYILDSEFESGLFENSNWNSGYIIESNNDSNITIKSVEGGFYNLDFITQSSTLLATTTANLIFKERDENYFKVGDIVYLNSVTYDTTGKIETFSLIDQGSGYTFSEYDLIGSNGEKGVVSLTVDGIGQILSVDLISGGFGYEVGDVLTIGDPGSTGSIQVSSLTGSIVELPDTYKISSISDEIIELSEVYATNSVLSTLTEDGKYYTSGLRNRYGYLHSVKFKKALLKEGFLKGVYLHDTLIKNENINLNDKDFLNINNFKSLLVSDILFSDNKNILSRASYVNSNFKYGSDKWDDGLFYNSVWNSGFFKKGLIKQSTWHDGILKTGTFYDSRSFNANPTTDYRYYDTDRIRSYYKSGFTSATISNDRYSWRTGTFSNGEFLKSDWDSGKFLNGKFYNSKWYSGTFKNGTIGDVNIAASDTWFYNGLIEKAVVDNANIYAIDTSFLGLSSSNILWKTGIFNSGIFGCDIVIQKTASNTAIWETGNFNGGEFQTNGKWLNGTFSGGKFISGYGWTMSTSSYQISNLKQDFGWEDGEFNGGEFGNAEYATNSTWWSGSFNGGKFQGRIWNDGIFTNGDFIGGSTYSAVGGFSVDSMTYSNANDFVLSFDNNFWGIWSKGIVSPSKDEFITNSPSLTPLSKSNVVFIPQTTVRLKNMLWLSGTFSHFGGSIENSIWLDGSFSKGQFKMSSFNPWVKKFGPLSSESFNTNDDLINASGSCIWNDGSLYESDFYTSQWLNGNFISGTAIGMIWKNGKTSYMNAYNVLWENGTWRNGNWFGSFIKIEEDGSIQNKFHRALLQRGNNWSGTDLSHVWNVFEENDDDLSQMGFKSATSSLTGLAYEEISMTSPAAKGPFSSI